jgi:hypothetical protein
LGRFQTRPRPGSAQILRRLPVRLQLWFAAAGPAPAQKADRPTRPASLPL